MTENVTLAFLLMYCVFFSQVGSGPFFRNLWGNLIAKTIKEEQSIDIEDFLWFCLFRLFFEIKQPYCLIKRMLMNYMHTQGTKGSNIYIIMNKK